MKKKLMNMLLVIGCVMTLNLFAESVAEWMENLDKMLVPVVDTDWRVIEKWSKLGELKQKAIMRSDWASALEYAREQFKVRQGKSQSVMEAETHLEMSLLLWNNNLNLEAKKSMLNCIQVLGNDSNIDISGRQRALELYALMNKNQLLHPISSEQFYPLIKQIMEIANKQWKNGLERMKNQDPMFQMFRD